MEVYIETLTGSIFGLTVSNLETVLSLKAKIQRLEGIPVSQQHLIWQSMELEDDYSLQDYKIKEGATIKLVISMRGGPINTRRVAIEDPTWKEIADYMEANREELWEKLPGGRQVTLLVFRDGDQINFFRVIDRGDGTVAPVAEALSQSSFRSLCTDEVESVEQQRRRENNVTMQKMRSIRKEMEALTLKKKPKRSHHTFTPSFHSKIRTGHSFASTGRFTRLPPVLGHRMSLASQPSSRTVSPSPNNIDRPKGASVISAVPRRLSQTSLHDGQCQTPDGSSAADSSVMHLTTTTSTNMPAQECIRAPDLRAVSRVHGDSISRLQTLNGENDVVESRWQQNLWAPTVSNSSDNLNSSERRNAGLSNGSLAMLSSSAADLPTKRHIRNCQHPLKTRSTFENFEQLQQTLAKFDPRISVQSSPRSRISSVSNRKTILDGMGFLSSMQLNCDERLSSASDGETIRPMTSPEIDDSKKCINKNNKIRPKEEIESSSSSRDKMYSRSEPAVRHPAAERKYSNEKDTSVQLLKDKFTATTKREAAEGNKLAADAVGPAESGSKSPCDEQSEVLKLPPLRKTKRASLRCQVCGRKLGLATTYTCRCGQQLCATHRYAEMHSCTHDYKTEGRKILELSNPLVTAPKLPKI